MTVYLAWSCTAIAILMTSVGHVFYKKFATNRKLILFALTFAFFIGAQGFSYFALQILSVADVYLCTALIPVIAMFFGRVFFNERITSTSFLCIGMITIGTFIYLLG